MKHKILYFFILFVFLLTKDSNLLAQVEWLQMQNSHIIKGTRHIPYPSYSGTPYLNDKFVPGEIEFSDGTKVGISALRYSSYRDELIYYNSAISAQIIIDKITLKGFSFTDNNGVKRVFRQQYYDGFLNGNRYFEVLSDGNISLLVNRKVVLQTCSVYADPSGVQKNMSYQEAYNYFIYSSEKGYEPIRIGKNSLLSKFDMPAQKSIKKLLRKNKVVISNETGFVKAWNLLEGSGIYIQLMSNK